MDTLLIDGDFVKNAFGHPVTVNGMEELLQRILIRLSVKRGTFTLDKLLGSKLYMLSGANIQNVDREALTYVKESLMDMPGIQVLSAKTTLSENNNIDVAVKVKVYGEVTDITVEVTD